MRLAMIRLRTRLLTITPMAWGATLKTLPKNESISQSMLQFPRARTGLAVVVLVGETLLDSTVTLVERKRVLQPPPIIAETNLDVDGVADLVCGKVGRERDGSVLAELAREHVAGSAAVSLGVAHPAVEKERAGECL